MTPNTTISTADKAVQPPSSKGEIYILTYRHGSSVFNQKGFFHRGDIKSATARAKEHCNIMGYRFIYVKPQTEDLDEAERRHKALPEPLQHE